VKVKHIALLLIGTLWFALGNAQKYNQELDDFDPGTKRQDKFGVRLGFGFNTLMSPQLVNSKTTRGYQGAFYYRVNLFKGFHLNPEFGASIRGSRYNNGTSGYTQISLLYFDFSLLGMIQLDRKYNNNLVLGMQASRLMRSSVFVGKEPYPAFLQLPFKNYDYAAVVGYHFNLQYVGFQLSLKYGLRNVAKDFSMYNKKSLNTSLEFVDLKPSLRNVNNIRNISVELSIYF
jgi:hypothetical protein